MKRLRIEHETGFKYAEPVTASYNEARMLPTTTDSQFVLSANLEIQPQTSVSSSIDYFGTRVASFEVVQPHTELTIISRSLVEVRDRAVDLPDLTWDALRREAERSVETVENLTQTSRTKPHDEVVALAGEIASKHESPADAARAVATTLSEAVGYVRGTTGVNSTAIEAWEARRGIGQDIAHITIGALRSLGVPARYASGYVHPREHAEVGVAVESESHAWVEYFVGEWVGFDIATRSDVTDRHVLVGHGRDYADVPPLRGVFAGRGRNELHVSVTITREA